MLKETCYYSSDMENCPQCGTRLVYDGFRFNEMSEGQQADYKAGFVDQKCPKCGYEIEGSAQ